MRRALTIIMTAALAIARPAQAQNHEVVALPLAAGPFAVACTNIAQDEAAIAASGAAPADFWEGREVGGRVRYITEVLAHPSSVVRYAAAVPDLREIYPRFAGETVEHVAIVCHPTPRDNPDADYVLPGAGGRVPRMQQAGAALRLISVSEYLEAFGVFLSPPVWSPAALPSVVFSHGLGGSPLGEGYINAMVGLASHGFIVGAVFHGDPRFSRIRIEDLSDFVYVLRDFDKFVEMELMRPVSLKALVDTLLAHPQLGPAIDPERIGGFGASMGGQAMANLLGARLTTSLGLACRQTVRDPRIKAAVGLVPYAGQTFLPAFCDDQNGADDVSRPYLAISGTADTTAPIKMVEQAIHRFGSSRYLVELQGVKHEFLPEHAGDVFTWTVTFLRAYLGDGGDPPSGAMSRLIRMASVAGGPADGLRVDVHVPISAGPNGTTVVEFHNEILDHYFIAASGFEVEQILSGAAGPGWRRTGQSFNAFSRIPFDSVTRVAPVCRFYGVPAGGPNSHFFTASPDECEAVKRAGGWYYEGIGFFAEPQGPDGRCPAGYLQVRRAYNQGWPRNDSNHRFTTSDSTWREMARHGWALEGVAWCARP
ncbi:MAG: hypothetical protein KF738_01095 [Burkholderiales bacterium]|nr:hypothetical protein [Burkholderiales bacterium]